MPILLEQWILIYKMGCWLNLQLGGYIFGEEFFNVEREGLNRTNVEVWILNYFEDD